MKPTQEFRPTSLAGYVTASYEDLVAALGEPNVAGDGYKVSTEWCLEHDGRVWTIYDYKATTSYDELLPSVEQFRAWSSYDWHVGGEYNVDVTAFIDAVQSKLAEARSKRRHPQGTTGAWWL